MGKKCPFCNQLITEEQEDSLNNTIFCAACQIERLVSEQGKLEQSEKE